MPRAALFRADALVDAAERLVADGGPRALTIEALTDATKAVRRPRQVSRTVRPLAPESIERIRLQLGARDATLVSVLAYADTFEEFDPSERIRAGTAIAQAREQLLSPNVRVCTRASPTRLERSAKTARESKADGGIRTHDPRFTRAVLWPTELRRRLRGRV